MKNIADWEIRFNEMNKNCDGAYGCGQFPPEVKRFIAKELADARREVIAKEKKKTLDKVYEIRKVCDHASPCNCLVYNRAISDVLSTLRKEES